MKLRVFAALGVLLLGSGCGTTAKFVYPSDPSNLIRFSATSVFEGKVAVTPFEEYRSDKNSFSPFYLYLIPLMPFGYFSHDRPEAARTFVSIQEFDFDASEDLAKAAASSVRRSGLFDDAFFTYGGDKENADYVLEGDIISARYEGAIYSYGLSFVGTTLWLIGFPSGSSENFLTLHMRLLDRPTGETLWEFSTGKKWRRLQGLYYRFGHDVKGYVPLMEEIMNEALTDMNNTLSNSQAVKRK